MLLTSRTPLRISFFGGGTDYPEYIEQNRGAVLGMAINKYIYISTLQLGSFLDYKYRLSYSKHEKVNEISEIEHPVVRAILAHYKISDPLDISVLSDLPARSGLGSSSSFTVGFLNLIERIIGCRPTKYDLAEKAIFFEREMLSENVGLQDQYHAAYGGINRFDFHPNRIQISPIKIGSEKLNLLSSSLYLVYTGTSRFASDILTDQIKNTINKTNSAHLDNLLNLTDIAVDLLEKSNTESLIKDFGSLLHESWETKKALSGKVTTSSIDELYDLALKNGAISGKLCGAGGGGFFLLLAPNHTVAKLNEALNPLKLIPIQIDTDGSTIIYS